MLAKQMAAVEQALIDRRMAEVALEEAAERASAATSEHRRRRRELQETVNVARRLGAKVDPRVTATAGIDNIAKDTWAELTRLDAVEQVLHEAGKPLHINQLLSTLVDHGREDDNYQLVSAALANLRQRRASVRGIGGGQWEFVPLAKRAETRAFEEATAREIARLTAKRAEGESREATPREGRTPAT